MKPLLIFEANEVPWRLIDYLKDDPRFSNLSRFFSEASTWTTHAQQEKELSPWITWPSLHRGMTPDEHGINFLGQDPSHFKGTPIWQEYRERGLSIGVCGSLQSWPPTEPGPKGFFVPDVFAQSPQCYPSWLEPFQSFNQQQVRENGLVVRRNSIFSKEVLNVMKALPSLKLRPKTYVRILGQLLFERLSKRHIAKRQTFQAMLYWDAFKTLVKAQGLPELSTFFTNHVASAMHRYWHELFPNDFKDDAPPGSTGGLWFAIKILDEMLGEAMQLVKLNPNLTIAFASSMGQGPCTRPRYEGVSLLLPKVDRLMALCGLAPNEYRQNFAMVPQVALRIDSDKIRAKTQVALRSARVGGKVLFAIHEIGETLSVSVNTPSKSSLNTGYFSLLGNQVSWADAGMTIEAVEVGTAYHIPEGILGIWGTGERAGQRLSDRVDMPLSQVKSLLMTYAGVL
ncbi:MAG: hypothetical protein V4534_05150 [Myxococcota bacterium]